MLSDFLTWSHRKSVTLKGIEFRSPNTRNCVLTIGSVSLNVNINLNVELTLGGAAKYPIPIIYHDVNLMSLIPVCKLFCETR